MMDVTSLYTNIYHVDEVDICSRLPNHPKPINTDIYTYI